MAKSFFFFFSFAIIFFLRNFFFSFLLKYLSAVDQIVVLRAGRVAEIGTYRQLMENEGEFSALIKKHVVENDKENAESEKSNDDDDEELIEQALEEEITHQPHQKTKKGKGKGKAAKDAKADEENDKGKLIGKEELETGEVHGSVYLRYVMALGGVFVGLMCCFLFALDQASNVLANWWLEFW